MTVIAFMLQVMFRTRPVNCHLDSQYEVILFFGSIAPPSHLRH
jgi:hypothetical protein